MSGRAQKDSVFMREGYPPEMLLAFVCEDGRVIAVGSHDELINTCPEYARMVELQRLEEEAAR